MERPDTAGIAAAALALVLCAATWLLAPAPAGAGLDRWLERLSDPAAGIQIAQGR
ncbi:hypothetical protein [Magnetospirillum sp. UT-4]|uniref:hypothetical protein n=1 Tax=Magnetospirillum sp. UT-4 TaxID=2681467 RepID=UPI0015742EED|nr:hypothetical protein [Magnetospirillum sp. UT-4]